MHLFNMNNMFILHLAKGYKYKGYASHLTVMNLLNSNNTY